MTPEQTAKLLAYLASATGKRFEEGDVILWRDMLKDLPDESVTRAVHRYVRERKEMPTVADIREMASEVQHGELDESSAAFDRLTKAVRRYGTYDQQGAKEAVDPLTWAAMEAAGGWGWACDLTVDNRQTYAAQFRMAYQALAGREERHRRLPQVLRPAITNDSTLVSLPKPADKAPLALPAPEQPSPERIEKSKLLRVFREPPVPVAVPSQEEWDRRREAQMASVKRITPKT